MKYEFPPPPNFHGEAVGPEVPNRVRNLEILSCDGSGVLVQLGYANGDGSMTERISMSLPAALKLASELDSAVDDYLYETGKPVPDDVGQED